MLIKLEVNQRVIHRQVSTRSCQQLQIMTMRTTAWLYLKKTVTLCIYHPPHLHQKTARMSVRTCSDVFSSVEKHSLPPTTLFQIFNTVKVHEKIHTIPYQSTPHCKRLKQLFLHVPGSRFHIFIMVAHST